MKLLCAVSAFVGLACGLSLDARAETNNSGAVSAVAPPCAVRCMADLIPKSTCSMTDVACVCTNEYLIEAINNCVVSTCTIKESLTTAKYSEVTCARTVRSRSKMIKVIAILGCILPTLAVILRVISRMTGAGGQWGIDDYIIVPTTFFLMLPFSVACYLLADAGMGQDIWDIPFDDITRVLKIYFSLELGYLLIGALTKMTILFLYLRLFPSTSFKKMVYAVMSLVVVCCFVWEVISIFQCTPLDGAWLAWDGDDRTWVGKCRNVNAQAWGAAAVNMILDGTILVLPVMELYRLTLSIRQKIQIMVMFSTGIFVTLVSLVRLKSLLRFANSTNSTWDGTAMECWSHVELQVAIVCACMPAMRTLFRAMFPSSTIANSSADMGPSKYSLGSSSASSPRKASFDLPSYDVKATDRNFVPQNDEERVEVRYTLEPIKVEAGRTLEDSTFLGDGMAHEEASEHQHR